MQTSKVENKLEKVIHAARYQINRFQFQYLLLIETTPHSFQWFEWNEKEGTAPTSIIAGTKEEACRQARKQLKNVAFRMVHCGFRYSLPERDEHGMNAFFHQMAASYFNHSKIYFDTDLGHNCFVDFASLEALNLWKSLIKSFQ